MYADNIEIWSICHEHKAHDVNIFSSSSSSSRNGEEEKNSILSFWIFFFSVGGRVGNFCVHMKRKKDTKKDRNSIEMEPKRDRKKGGNQN